MNETQEVFHGTDKDFTQFSLGAIGTGEGCGIHGWGIYFAEVAGVAETYRDRSARLENAMVLRVRIPARDQFLHWDITLGSQPDIVQQALPTILERLRPFDADAFFEEAEDDCLEHGNAETDYLRRLYDAALAEGEYSEEFSTSVWEYLKDCAPNIDWKVFADNLFGNTFSLSDDTGRNLYEALVHGCGSEREAALYLKSFGIPGACSWDNTGSEDDERRTCNYVVWDESRMKILERIKEQPVIVPPPTRSPILR